MLMNNAQTLLDKKNVVNRLTLRTNDYTKAREYAAQIESIAGYKTESWQETNSNFLSIFVVQDVITGVITGALLVVAAFGVLNILVMAVLERVNDIAIMPLVTENVKASVSSRQGEPGDCSPPHRSTTRTP